MAKVTIGKTKFEKRVYRWELNDPQWSGRTSFVALVGAEVVLGERFGAHEERYACHWQDFAEGCFNTLVSEQFGQNVLDEVLVEVKRGLEAQSAGVLPPWPEVGWAKRAQARRAEAKRAEASVPKKTGGGASLGSKVFSAPDAGKAHVVLVGCERVDMTLAFALRSLTGKKTADVLKEVSSLPLLVQSNVAKDVADASQARLVSLGAQVEVV